MNLIQHLCRSLRPAAMVMHAPTHALCDDVQAQALPDLDDTPRGCAWFDSSWDLRQGLRVVEHDLHGVRQHVPLAWLLQ